MFSCDIFETRGTRSSSPEYELRTPGVEERKIGDDHGSHFSSQGWETSRKVEERREPVQAENGRDRKEEGFGLDDCWSHSGFGGCGGWGGSRCP
jgi:hypothetical protein